MATNNNSGANIGFENELWKAADALRSNMDAAEYTLAALRDTLLPKLISGELRVPDAERFVGRCVS